MSVSRYDGVISPLGVVGWYLVGVLRFADVAAGEPAGATGGALLYLSSGFESINRLFNPPKLILGEKISSNFSFGASVHVLLGVPLPGKIVDRTKRRNFCMTKRDQSNYDYGTKQCIPVPGVNL